MISVDDLYVNYGPIEALHGVSLKVNAGEIVALVGANGAGKSTLLRAISGLIPSRGQIQFDGRHIAGLRAEQVARLGLAHVPEGRHVFPGLTVLENLECGAYTMGYSRSQIRSDLRHILTTFPGLAARARAYAWSLSGGEQQMLAIGRALMARPRLLLLDEPSLGLAPKLVQEVFRIIARIGRQEGRPILLVEQNARVALSLADRGYLLEQGRIVRSGTGPELLNDPGIIAAYLGGHSKGGEAS